MTETAAALLDQIGGWGWISFVVFLRVGASMALLPAFGEQSVPVRIRLALAFAFTAIVAPAVATRLPDEPAAFGGFVPIVLAETASGFALGLSVRLFVWMLQVTGSIAAQSTSLSQLMGGAAVDPQPAISQLLVIAGFALAVIAGLHVQIARAFILSYDALPAGLFPVAGDFAEWGLARVSAMFGLAFSFSAPFVIAALVYNVALGVINKAMPQLMVAFVGAPAITAGGLVLLLLAMPLILPIWLEALQGQLADPMGMPR